MGCPSLRILGTCLHHVREGLKAVRCCQKGAGEMCTHSTSISRLEHQHEGGILKLMDITNKQTQIGHQ